MKERLADAALADDQTHVDRLGLFYFARAPHDLELKVVPSPLLKRLGQYPSEETSGTVTGKGESLA